MAEAATPLTRDDLRRRWAARELGLVRLGRWEACQAVEPPDQDAIARVGVLFDLLPAEARCHDSDPGKLGIQVMHRTLAIVGSFRR